MHVGCPSVGLHHLFNFETSICFVDQDQSEAIHCCNFGLVFLTRCASGRKPHSSSTRTWIRYVLNNAAQFSAFQLLFHGKPSKLGGSSHLLQTSSRIIFTQKNRTVPKSLRVVKTSIFGISLAPPPEAARISMTGALTSRGCRWRRGTRGAQICRWSGAPPRADCTASPSRAGTRR